MNNVSRSETNTDRVKRAILATVVPTTGELWPDHAGTYRCPLCARFFAADDLGALSLDHVPPSALTERRRIVVVTCRQCNNAAGETVDDAMFDHEELRQIRAGNMTRPRESVITTDLGKIVTNTQIGPDGIAVMAAPKASHQTAFAAWLKEFEEAVTHPGSPIKLSGTFYPRRPQHWAKLGWLRSAYLIAFASGGYFYAFDPALDPVRAQLDAANRDAVIIEKYAWRLQDADTCDGEVVYVHEPESFRSIAVRMGDVLVLLPVRGDADLYSRLSGEPTDLRTLNLRSAPVPWPVPATYGTASRN